MIQLGTIQDALLHLVGWQQGFGENRILESLTESESGLSFQGAHPLVTLDNIRSIMPTEWGASAWDASATYTKGDAVEYGGKIWIAEGTASGVAPSYESGWIDALSWTVRRLTVEGIATAVQNFLTTKKINRETKSIVERRPFFDGAARLAATIRPTGKLVGFEIIPVRAMGVVTKLESIGLQFAGGNGTVRIYIFNSNDQNPVYVKDCVYTKNGGFQWFALDDVYLPYLNDAGAGGAWFICYIF